MKIKRTTVQIPTILAVFFGVLVPCIIVTPFLLYNNIIYGSMISWQFHPNTTAYYLQAKEGIYALFNWSFGLGFNTLGDSQQSLLHPIKILLTALLSSHYAIDTYFLTTHFILLFVSFFLLTKQIIGYDRVIRQQNLIAFFGSISFGLSIAVYANFIHIFFIVTLAYGNLLLCLVDKALEKPSRLNFLCIALTTTVMVLAGNFSMQWLILLLAVFYALTKTIINSRPISSLWPVAVALGLGLLIAAPQLVPTFEAMQVSSRGQIGGLDKFQQSPGPFQWLSYLVPGVTYFLYKHAPEAFSYIGGNNVVEGTHYVGIIPMILLIYLWASVQKIPRHMWVLVISLVFLYLKALGVFSPFNIVLNYFPIFGQFRIPIRTFFVINIIVCLLASMCLLRSIDRRMMSRSIYIVLGISFVFTLFAIPIPFMRSLAFNFLSPPITLSELGYMCISMIVAGITLFFVKQKSLSDNMLRSIIVLIAIIDVSTHLIGVPTHWRSEPKSLLEERAYKTDLLCQSIGAKEIYMFENEYGEDIWPNFDVPLFPLGRGNEQQYSTEDQTTPEPNGVNCSLTHSFITSTLTPKAIKEVRDWIEKAENKKLRSEAINLVGYAHTAYKTNMVGLGDVYNEITLSNTEVYSEKTLSRFKLFITNYKSEKNKKRIIFIKKITHILKQWNLLKRLPTTIRKPIYLQGIGSLIMLPPPFSYLIKQDGKNIEPKEIRGSFAVFEGKIKKPLIVTYVPIAFLVGLMISCLGIIMLSIFIFFYRPKKYFMEVERMQFISRVSQFIDRFWEIKGKKYLLTILTIPLIFYTAHQEFHRSLGHVAVYFVGIISIILLSMAVYFIARLKINHDKSFVISLLIALFYIFGLTVYRYFTLLYA